MWTSCNLCTAPDGRRTEAASYVPCSAIFDSSCVFDEHEHGWSEPCAPAWWWAEAEPSGPSDHDPDEGFGPGSSWRPDAMAPRPKDVPRATKAVGAAPAPSAVEESAAAQSGRASGVWRAFWGVSEVFRAS